MKKLNLQLGSIKEMLTKEQMKKIVGGGGYDGGTCTYTWSGPYDGHLGCASGSQSGPCIGAIDQCQAGADAQCDPDPCCSDVSCS